MPVGGAAAVAVAAVIVVVAVAVIESDDGVAAAVAAAVDDGAFSAAAVSAFGVTVWTDVGEAVAIETSADVAVVGDGEVEVGEEEYQEEEAPFPAH